MFMKIVYRVYLLIVALPVMTFATFLTSVCTIVGCAVGKASFWGYFPAMMWSRVMCVMGLLPVRVEGLSLLNKEQSYVFVANHQGPYDIFLVYGYIGRNFKWMMKKSLRSIPLVGKACESAGHVFVDKSGPKAIQATYDKARVTLSGGVSLVVFPEGARSFTGHMGKFRRGAFQLADELQLPVVPVTIDGSFDVLPRQKGFNFLTWHPLRLVIHAPLFPEGRGNENVNATMKRSYDIIMGDLPEKYRGFVENPDQ